MLYRGQQPVAWSSRKVSTATRHPMARSANTESAKGPRLSKIIFINRFFYPDLSATSQMLSDLAFGLSQEGFSIRIITSRQRYEDPAARLPSIEHTEGVLIHRVPTTSFGRRSVIARSLDYLTFYVSSFLACLKVARRGDILVAKTDPPLISVVVMVAARLRGAQVINWLQDLYPDVAVELG